MTAVRDFLGTPLEVGAVVVYPATSGRSTQMVEAVVLELGEVKLPPLRDAGLQSIRVRPTGRTSRYGQHTTEKCHTVWDTPDGEWAEGAKVRSRTWTPVEVKPVTLTANAVSVVVLKRPGPLPGWHHVPNGHPDYCA